MTTTYRTIKLIRKAFILIVLLVVIAIIAVSLSVDHIYCDTDSIQIFEFGLQQRFLVERV